MKKEKYAVVVEKISPLLVLHPLDIDVPGVYFYEDDGLYGDTESEKKEGVLDRFHHEVPIKVLEDFDIEVHKIKSIADLRKK